MAEVQLSNEDFKQTLEHLVLGFSSVLDPSDLRGIEIDKALVNMQDHLGGISKNNPAAKRMAERLSRLGDVSKIKPAGKSIHELFSHKKMEKKIAEIKHKLGSIFLCDFCVFVLKQRLKKINSLTTLPAIKGRLMKERPVILDLNKSASDVYTLIAYQKELYKGVIKTEESKLQYLKALKSSKRKRVKKDDLRSLFFKKRAALKSSLVRMGKKNTGCILRAYELFSLKVPTKTGELLHSQKEVADALVREGLVEKCSQQSVSMWNNLVERELKGWHGK